jgi:hypothetical protein
MNILYICHRFPFPPKRGGKIRPFNMIRHLSASGHRVTVCSLARSAAEAEEGQGIAAHCERFAMGLVSEPVQTLRMVARLPLTTPSSMGYFHSPSLRRQVDRLLQAEKWDLIFVHCSSVAQYVERVRTVPKILDFGDMDSQKWLEYANYKPFPLSLGYRLEGTRCLPPRSVWRRLFDLCTATTRAEWQTLEGYRTGVATDWFPNGVDADFFSPTDGCLRRRHPELHRPHGLLPEPGVHGALLRADLAAAAGTSAAAQAVDRRRRSVSRDAPPGRVARASPSPARCPTCVPSSGGRR